MQGYLTWIAIVNRGSSHSSLRRKGDGCLYKSIKSNYFHPCSKWCQKKITIKANKVKPFQIYLSIKKTQYRDDYYATWRSGLVIGILALEANNLSLVNNSVFLVDFLAIAVGMKGPFRIPPKHTQFQRHLER